ncbi:S8 family peptidase [Flaviaesturariibacter aridisoli]|uniref:T9SS type A sorting domain-containing protein n=1 Tax=Flaviaesturariibacter aridisoli TaxID=2545761 RepID=A0A4R4E7T4_9BACT|nr:S8 family peptidase [Flaviaesturariibacter aridisoli]TCZ74131.1 T9SS type A sorting domain-containing protein [Flaviaesturariibacter aridisoli]
MLRPALRLLLLLLISAAHAHAQTNPPPPNEELTSGFLDRSLNRINLVQDRYPSLRGDSLTAAVKEQSFDTSDIDLKGRILTSSRAAATATSHASLMATIIAGGGNSSPFAFGAAPAALLTSVSFGTLFPEPDSFYRRLSITVENHSYGSIVESVYGNEAAAYDSAAVRNSSLAFVFSSGNSGTAAPAGGPYAGLSGWSNLTGNFKNAKNVLVVGAADSLGVLEALSSRGPAHDGRVKPELTAFGQDGSSGASALVSGTALLLQQAYRLRTGTLPPSSLLRAVLLNSAEDAGPGQVDYQYGYGRLNAWDAVQTIQEGRYRIDSLAQGETRIFTINVPASLSRLRVLAAWTDAPAAPGAAKALVNDLDLQLEDGASAITQPWVLQPAANAATLSQAARRGLDTLNNQEQVTVDNPSAGIYTVRVQGSRVVGRQVFSLAWQFDTASRFQWTFPGAGDPLSAGSRTVLRWLSNRSGSGTLEWSLNGGAWQPIASSVDPATSFFAWQAPDTTGLVRFRLRGAGPDAISDETVISRRINLGTGFNCSDSFLLLWNHVPPQNYRLYELADRYLAGFRSSTDSFALLRKSDHPSLYYAVAPLVAGRPGQRSFILKYDAQGVECYFRSFYLSNQAGNRAEFTASIGTAFGVTALVLQRQEGSTYVTRQTLSPLSGTNFLLADTGLHEGINRYRLQLQLAGGAVFYSELVTAYYFPGLPVLVFPNPVPQGRPVTVYSNEPGRYTVQVVDATGRELYRNALNALTTPVPLPALPSGLYFVRFTSESGVVDLRKLVVY